MIKKLNIEFLKIKGSTSFKVFALFFLVLFPAILLLLPSSISIESGGFKFYPLMPKTAENSWYFATYIASWFSLFILAFIIIFQITNEFSNRTVRQNIIDGYTKLDYVKGKLYLILAMTIIATIYVFIVSIVAVIYFKSKNTIQIPLGELTNQTAEGMPEIIPFGGIYDGVFCVIRYFLQVFAYFILAFFISFLIKKGVFTVFIYLFIFIIEKIIGAQLTAQKFEYLVDYLPLQSFSNILPNPDLEKLFTGAYKIESLHAVNYLVYIFYTIGFIYLTYFVFKKRDVN